MPKTSFLGDLVNIPKRELKIFTEREGGVEHCSIDNMPMVRDFICDWVDETVAELRAGRFDRRTQCPMTTCAAHSLVMLARNNAVMGLCWGQ